MAHTFDNCSSLESVRFNQTNYHNMYVIEYDPLLLEYKGMLNIAFVNKYNVTTVESEAFINCPALSTVIVDGMQTNFGENVFVDCGDLTFYCYEGSDAEKYAKANGYDVVYIPTEMTDYERMIFDEDLYLENYPELKENLQLDSEELLYAHWLAEGMQNGMVVSHIIDPQYYLNANPDLKEKFGDDCRAAYDYFLSQGYKELRQNSAEYDGAAYKARYSFLADKSAEELIENYLTYGIPNGRSAKTEATLGVYGDADGDGILTAGDAAMLYQKVLNSSYQTELEKKFGTDAFVYINVDDSDNEITVSDPAMVFQKVLNGSFVMPVEKNK